MHHPLWLVVRVACIAASAMAGASAFGHESTFPIPYWVVLLALAAGALTMKLWVRPLYPRVVPDVSWTGPTWTANPLALREPLHAFHLMALCFVALGIAGLAGRDPRALAVGAFGVGLYLGVLWVRQPPVHRATTG